MSYLLSKVEDFTVISRVREFRIGSVANWNVEETSAGKTLGV